MYGIGDMQIKTVRRNYLPKVSAVDKYLSMVFMLLTVFTIFALSLRLIIRI